MAKDRSDGSVVLPLLGSGVLGATAYGSHKLNKAMSLMGIADNLKLNPEAIEAINDYANLRPDKLNPHEFAQQYSHAAHRAASAQLFKGDDRKVWEWEINNPLLRRGILRQRDKLLSKVDHTGELARRLSERLKDGKLKTGLSGLGDKLSTLATAGHSFDMFSPHDYYADKLGIRSKAGNLALFADQLAHTPEMAQSELASHLRLLNEIAGGTNAQVVADHTVEALMNYKNPKYQGFIGKKFKTPHEYFNAIMSDGHIKYPHLYDKYIDSFSDTMSRLGTNSEAVANEVKSMLAHKAYRPGSSLHSKALQSELADTIGRKTRWNFSNKSLDRIVRGTTSLNADIRSVQDILDKTVSHAGLKFLHAQAAQNYGNTSINYGKIFKTFRIAQALRSKKLKAIAGLGSLGLLGLGGRNLKKRLSNDKD